MRHFASVYFPWSKFPEDHNSYLRVEIPGISILRNFDLIFFDKTTRTFRAYESASQSIVTSLLAQTGYEYVRYKSGATNENQ